MCSVYDFDHIVESPTAIHLLSSLNDMWRWPLFPAAFQCDITRNLLFEFRLQSFAICTNHFSNLMKLIWNKNRSIPVPFESLFQYTMINLPNKTNFFSRLIYSVFLLIPMFAISLANSDDKTFEIFWKCQLQLLWLICIRRRHKRDLHLQIKGDSERDGNVQCSMQLYRNPAAWWWVFVCVKVKRMHGTV